MKVTANNESKKVKSILINYACNGYYKNRKINRYSGIILGGFDKVIILKTILIVTFIKRIRQSWSKEGG